MRLRAALPHMLPRLTQQHRHSISRIGSIQLQHQLIQLRHYSTPLCRPRMPLNSPPVGVASHSFFSSLVAGREEEKVAQLLDAHAGTVRCAANYAPLTPISFIERAAAVYGDRPAVVYGEARPTTWREARERCVRVAASLAARFGVARGDVVAVLSPNVPAMYELHFAVPMAGAVLCTLNTRHDAAMVSTLLSHSGAKVFLVESSLLDVGRAALKRLADSQSGAASLPVLVTISDETVPGRTDYDYEGLIKDAPSHFDIRWPANELDPIALNYTSGTTSRPKGVVYNHRGAYLNTVATVLACDVTPMPTYLWTVPMFHGNGWHMAWGVAMQGGTSVCLRHFTAKVIFDNIVRHAVTHMGGAPTVLNMVVNAPAEDREAASGDCARHDGRRASAAARPVWDGGARLHAVPHIRPNRDVQRRHRVHVEAGVGRAAARGARVAEGTPGAPPRRDAGRRCQGPGHHGERAARREDGRRGDVPRKHRHEWVLQGRRGDQRIHDRRVAAHRRPRRAAPRRVRSNQRQGEGHHYIRR